MIEDVRKLFQDVFVPELESLRGEIRAVEARLLGRLDALDQKLEKQIQTLIQKIDYQILDTRMRTLEDRLNGLDENVDLIRHGLLRRDPPRGGRSFGHKLT